MVEHSNFRNTGVRFFFFHLWSVGPLLLNVQCVIRFWPSNSFICIWNDCDGEIGCLLGQFPAKDSSIKGQFPTAPKISNHPMNWSLSRSMYGEIKNEKMKIGRPFGAGLASLFSLYIHIWSHSWVQLRMCGRMRSITQITATWKKNVAVRIRFVKLSKANEWWPAPPPHDSAHRMTHSLVTPPSVSRCVSFSLKSALCLA